MAKPRIVSVQELESKERKPPDLDGRKIKESYGPEGVAEEKMEEKNGGDGFFGRLMRKVKAVFGK